MFKLRTTECRVGVIGLYYSGKTVLLTSLINHLQEHDPDRFRLGDGTVTLRKFRELDPDPGWARFNYRGHRDQLVHAQRWPVKTTDRSQYVGEFERSDWHFTTANLKLYDLPGERIADAIMAGKDYAGWSDHMIGLLENDKAYRDCCHEFLDLLRARLGAELEELLRSYRVSLARLILSYKPYVSPSTFFLDTQGGMVEVRSTDGEPLPPEKIAAQRLAGLTPEMQFAPMPKRWREARPELAARFAEYYNYYRATVVLPLIGAIKSCHALIVLVDVVTLLASGHGMYNDNRQILIDLLEVLSPGETMLGKSVRVAANLFLPHGWRPGWITKIAFVAPKMDLVYPDQRDKMEELVRRMAEKLARDRDGLKTLYTNCSGVVSLNAFADKEGKYLTGLVKGELQKFPALPLPADWPLEWQPGAFVFPRVRPAVPPLRDCPPEQINLNRLLDFVMA